MVDTGFGPTVQLEASADAVRAVAVDRAQRRGVPALAYGIVGGGRLIAAGGVGDPGDGAGAPDERPLSRIASMTKSFAAAAVLNLRDTGHLALDAPASGYLPAAAGLGRATNDAPGTT